MRTRTNLFLCNLAVTDLLCALLDMPFSLATMIKGEWVFGDAAGVCVFNAFTTYFFWVASIHTLMYIAAFKYATIRDPFSAALNERTIAAMITAAWVWAGVVGYLSVHGLTDVKFQVSGGVGEGRGLGEGRGVFVRAWTH